MKGIKPANIAVMEYIEEKHDNIPLSEPVGNVLTWDDVFTLMRLYADYHLQQEHGLAES